MLLPALWHHSFQFSSSVLCLFLCLVGTVCFFRFVLPSQERRCTVIVFNVSFIVIYLQRKIVNKFSIELTKRLFFILRLFKFGMASGTYPASTLTCPFQGCDWSYQSMFGVDQSFQLITVHIESMHSTGPQASASSRKGPKLSPPQIDVGVDSETWRVFQVKWRQYCQGSQLREDMHSLHLFQCASEALGRLLIQSNAEITDCSPEVVMQAMERLAVIQSSRGATREELRNMTQGNDESIRTFAARVKGKAQTCGFQMKSAQRAHVP